MLLGYAARNAINPHANPAQVAAFQKLAMQQGQDLRKAVPGYHTVARQLVDRIQSLDEARRAAAHGDLNDGLLTPVAAGLTSGHTAPAIAQIAPRVRQLAQQYGVSVGAPPGGAPPVARPIPRGGIAPPSVMQAPPAPGM